MKSSLKITISLLMLICVAFCFCACNGNSAEEKEIKTETVGNMTVSIIEKSENGKVIETYGKVTSYTGSEITCTIPSTTPEGVKITAIGGLAFYRANVQGVIIGDNVTVIDSFAFGYADKLVRVDIPSSVTSIGEYAFVNCAKLSFVSIAASTPPTIGAYAFKVFNKDSKEDDQYVVSDNLQISVPDVEAYKGAWKDYADKIKVGA